MTTALRPPSVRNLWGQQRGLEEEQSPSGLAGEALPRFHDWPLDHVRPVGTEAHYSSYGLVRVYGHGN